MTTKQRLRESLLALDSPEPQRREQLQQEIQTMMIRELSMPRRAWMTALVVAEFGAALFIGSLVVTEPALPWLARIGLGAGTLFAIAWGAWFLRLLRRGEMDVRQDGRRMAQMVWCFTLLMVIFMVVVGATMTDRAQGTIVILQSFVFLIGAAVYWLTQQIEHAELNMTERLLRLELQLVELTEGKGGG
ncbi:hypothetical protein Pan44_43740 [Caulifigura coniformis]|uniref:Uncharacterized protein n=1 Tax=Caulifigura coniformis TaxID=2527983 RepID=A0A517SJL8_9PLAN|nr:intracellular growth attenuator family protein [Caulifigura coniformis]QDT56321.1 hypothetical protein Pan44_43740 [Caulifigura coniformis]